MANKMLIDAMHPEETRVVVLRGSRIEEFDFESASKRQLRGNIYLAKVIRVEPSLQAAFVDYGGNRHGFLAFSEIHPDYYQIPVSDRQALLAEEEHEEPEEEERRPRRSRRRRGGDAGDGGGRGARAAEGDAGAADEASPSTIGQEDGGLGQAERAQPARRRRENADAVSEPAVGDDLAASHDPASPSPHDEASAPADPTAGAAAGAADVGEPAAPAEPTGTLMAQADDTHDRAAPAADAAQDAAHHGAADHQTADHRAEDGAERDGAMLSPAAEAASPMGEGPVSMAGDGAVDTAASVMPAGETTDGRDDAADAGHGGAGRGEDGQDAAHPHDSHRAEASAAPVGHDASHDGEAHLGDARGDEAGDEEEHEEEAVEHVGGDALEEVPRRVFRPRRQYKIQEVIKRRQVLLVQVVKEERGNKGAAITTYLSLAGRYSVLMPNTARGGGISRKITDAGDRQRLKSIAQDLEVPDGMGVILRTAGASRSKPEVKRDFEYLMRAWETVRETTLASTAPMLVYEEGSLIKRAIRDLYNNDIEEIVVAGDEGYREAKAFMRLLQPSHLRNVVAWRESAPLFAKNGAEAQLDAMFHSHVTLKSGGYIVIGQTEALVAIDVNSGRSTREHNIEDTALRTNLEAADEVARQLRLRDLAGLIVVDFIDMEEGRNNRAVEKRMKDALKDDRARIQIGRISHFGLMEMSRQRIRTGVLEGSTEACPHCAGAGTVRSTASIALFVLRALEEALLADRSRDMTVRTRGGIALYILNNKRAHVTGIEERFGVTVTFEEDASLIGTSYCGLDRGEPATGVPQLRALPPEEVEEEPEAILEDEVEERAEPVGGEDEEPRRKRRRRRGRGRDESGERDAAEPAATAEAFDGAAAPAAEDAEQQPSDDALASLGGDGEADATGGDEERSSRRRRSRRGGRRSREGREASEGRGERIEIVDAEADAVVSPPGASRDDEATSGAAEAPASEGGATTREMARGVEATDTDEAVAEPSSPRDDVLRGELADAGPGGAALREEDHARHEVPLHGGVPDADAPSAAEAAGDAGEQAATASSDAVPAAADAVATPPGDVTHRGDHVEEAATSTEDAAAAAPKRPVPVSSETDPSRPKKSGWWSRAKATLGG